MIAAERFARAQHEFQFIHEELEKFEGQLQPMMSEWSAQLAGSAAAPQTWHARQFKDGTFVSKLFESVSSFPFEHEPVA